MSLHVEYPLTLIAGRSIRMHTEHGTVVLFACLTCGRTQRLILTVTSPDSPVLASCAAGHQWTTAVISPEQVVAWLPQTTRVA